MAFRLAIIIRLTLAAVAVLPFTGRSSGAAEAFSSTEKALFTTAVEKADPPPGWSDFCAQYVSECERIGDQR
jgi:predicted transglutaminase-like cysteine proteinase